MYLKSKLKIPKSGEKSKLKCIWKVNWKFPSLEKSKLKYIWKSKLKIPKSGEKSKLEFIWKK